MSGMNERHVRVLHMVAETYIDTAHPVPSGRIAERLEVSSATVRNDFGTLEEGGLLQQPHTSAGRIPTARGFHAYALSFLPPRRATTSRVRALRARLRTLEGDGLFDLASRAAAELSGYAVLVKLPPDESLRILEIHLTLLSSRRLLAVVVLENGLIRQIGVDLDPAPSDATIDDAERNLRQLTLPVGEVPAALRSLAASTDEDLSRTLTAVADAWGGLQQPRRFTGGLGRLLTEPEAGDAGFVKLVVDRFESDRGDDLEWHGAYGIALTEHLAQVGTAFAFAGGTATLTLVGPTRMRYRDAVAIAQDVSEALSAVTSGEPYSSHEA